MFDCFQSFGKVSDMLNNDDRYSHMEVAQPFNILLETPVAVLCFRDLRSLRTWSQVQLRDDMAGEMLDGDGDRNGGI